LVRLSTPRLKILALFLTFCTDSFQSPFVGAVVSRLWSTPATSFTESAASTLALSVRPRNINIDQKMVSLMLCRKRRPLQRGSANGVRGPPVSKGADSIRNAANPRTLLAPVVYIQAVAFATYTFLHLCLVTISHEAGLRWLFPPCSSNNATKMT
jgi:hypothetical protein